MLAHEQKRQYTMLHVCVREWTCALRGIAAMSVTKWGVGHAAFGKGRAMSVVGVGVLQAALEAQGAPALVLSGDKALALTPGARDILTEFFDYPPAPAAPPLSQPVLDFAALVLDAKGASLTKEVSATHGRKMKMTGAAHTDAATGRLLVILTLEKVLRRWDMFMDPKVGSVTFLHLHVDFTICS